MKISTTSHSSSIFPASKIPFSENRVRLPPDTNEMKKPANGDLCEVEQFEVEIRIVLVCFFRFSLEQKKMNHMAGGLLQSKCSAGISSLSFTKRVHQVPTIRILYQALTFVVQTQSKLR